LEIIMAYEQNQQVQSQPQTQQGEGYFDCHTFGVGYLYRRRWVTKSGNRKTPPSLWVGFNMLTGPKNNPVYAPYDLKVTGTEAIELIEALKPAFEDRAKVLAAVKIGDSYPDKYDRDELDENRQPTGRRETVAQIKGRLLIISMVKVNGEVFYRRPKDQVQTGQQQAQGDPQSAQPAAPENRKPAGQPKSQLSARPAQGATELATTSEKIAESAYADFDDGPY
jgi:hypothetical protein